MVSEYFQSVGHISRCPREMSEYFLSVFISPGPRPACGIFSKCFYISRSPAGGRRVSPDNKPEECLSPGRRGPTERRVVPAAPRARPVVPGGPREREPRAGSGARGGRSAGGGGGGGLALRRAAGARAPGRGVSRRPGGPWRSGGGLPGRAGAKAGRLVRGGPPGRGRAGRRARRSATFSSAVCSTLAARWAGRWIT